MDANWDVCDWFTAYPENPARFTLERMVIDSYTMEQLSGKLNLAQRTVDNSRAFIVRTDFSIESEKP